MELIDDFPDHPFKVRDDEDMMQLVESCLLYTSGVSKSILCFETLSLVDRVIQLGICVTHFPCITEELETLYLARIRRFLLGQRRNFDRMIHDKCRLDQFFLTVLLEEQVDDITLLVVCLIFNMMLVSKLFSCLIICYFIKVDSCIFCLLYTSVPQSDFRRWTDSNHLNI